MTTEHCINYEKCEPRVVLSILGLPLNFCQLYRGAFPLVVSTIYESVTSNGR